MDKMSEEFGLDVNNVEVLIRWFYLLIAIIVLGGILVASITGSGHWVDRSGKVMVAASLFLTFLQFHYEKRFPVRSECALGKIEKLVGSKGCSDEEVARVVARATSELQVRFDGVRQRVFLHALASAGVGELLAAFGDIAFSTFRQLFS